MVQFLPAAPAQAVCKRLQLQPAADNDMAAVGAQIEAAAPELYAATGLREVAVKRKLARPVLKDAALVVFKAQQALGKDAHAAVSKAVFHFRTCWRPR